MKDWKSERAKGAKEGVKFTPVPTTWKIATVQSTFQVKDGAYYY